MTKKKIMVKRDSLNWYEIHIEEPLRDLVRYLRNNGINTECCCAHDDPMYVQCQFMLDGTLSNLNHLLLLYYQEKGLKANYEIESKVTCRNDVWFSTLNIHLNNRDSDNIAYWTRMKKYYETRAKSYADAVKREKSFSRLKSKKTNNKR